MLPEVDRIQMSSAQEELWQLKEPVWQYHGVKVGVQGHINK
jgi:hypothetical protein